MKRQRSGTVTIEFHILFKTPNGKGTKTPKMESSINSHHSALKEPSFGVPLVLFILGPGHAKTCLMPYANNKGADQPAHLRSLISTFVVRCLDSMICILAISKVSRF